MLTAGAALSHLDAEGVTLRALLRRKLGRSAHEIRGSL